MGPAGVQPDVVSYTTAMDACASVGDIAKAQSLLSKMVEQGIQPNHRSFNAVMSAYGKAGKATEAIGVLGVSNSNQDPTPPFHFPFSAHSLSLSCFHTST